MHDPLIFKSFIKDLNMTTIVYHVTSRTVTLYMYSQPISRTCRLHRDFVGDMVFKKKIMSSGSKIELSDFIYR